MRRGADDAGSAVGVAAVAGALERFQEQDELLGKHGQVPRVGHVGSLRRVCFRIVSSGRENGFVRWPAVSRETRNGRGSDHRRRNRRRGRAESRQEAGQKADRATEAELLPPY